MIELEKLTIRKAREHLSAGDFTATELTEAYIKNIESKNNTINAYLEVFTDALATAKEADVNISNKKTSPLSGIPMAIKDNILINGKKSTSASKILEGFVAPYDATVISKLKEAGAVFLGRANMDEFAMGGSNENSAFGPVRNPYDDTRVSGGSSGGSAASVAMSGALAALGSDTGGSVRQPASFCGVVGLKPTYGSVSRFGLMAMGSSLDQIGPLTKTVGDSEIIFDIIRGKDIHDSTSIDVSKNSSVPKKLKIGVPRHFMKEGIDDDVSKNFEDSLLKLKSDGHTIVDITLPNISYSLAVYYVIMPAEASSNLARYDGVKYGNYKSGDTLLEDYVLTRTAGFGQEVRRRIMIGNYILSSGYYDAYYNKANLVRSLLGKDFNAAWKEVDCIVTPTSPVVAFKIGEKSSDPLAMYLADIFTVPANLVGIPALQVPSGFAQKEGKKLPLGIQFMAPHGKEDVLFSIGRQFFGE
jgi:aspartyl-tRNA(Asn)/glutamyl-tRNA(Gln) amidotransferase subunit A